MQNYGVAQEAGQRLPDAALQAAEPAVGLRTATLAGGCFWGVQGVFEHVRGVKHAVSGYAGGSQETATYETVSSGRTNHAEAVRISYDPAVIRYDELLQIFFSVALDPTQVNRQGPDTGPQYRSAIFPSDAEQARVAEAYIAQLEAAKVYSQPIATRIERDAAFYPAEGYHQDFMALHPRHLYIVANDAPKLRALQRFFSERVISEPVLVSRPPS
ncbi:Peptide methionine sulfoxide reductase MsrA [Methylobacterium soli]|nr:Peptide methionine sulfoxide reductase MsrA [Methylobacterium soli]